MLKKSHGLRKKSSSSKVITGIIGNLLEHYDQALFSLLVPFISPFLFTAQDELTALILAYGMSFISIITRPLGALFFGWIGDRFGRKYTLSYSLFGMALSTAALGSFSFLSLHSFYMPWLWLFILGAQGFCAAGESMNGAIFALEHTIPPYKNWVSALYGASSTGGWCLASALMMALGQWGDIATQWHYLCWFGVVTGLIGLMLRMKIWQDDSDQYLTNKPYIALREWYRYRKSMYRLIAASGFTYTTYYFAFTFLYSFVPLVSVLSKQEMLKMNTLLIGLDVLLSLCFGYLANRISSVRQMRWAALGTAFIALPVFYLLKIATWESVLVARVLVIVLGVAFGATYHAWTQTLVPQRLRCRMISLGNVIGAQLIGIPSTVVSLWIYQKSGWIGMPALYLIVTALMAAYAISGSFKLTYLKKSLLNCEG